MKGFIALLCLTLLATINAQCVITSAVAAFSASCSSSGGCALTASLLASLNTNLACSVATLLTGASVVLAPTGSGTLTFQVGTSQTTFGISSYTNLNITANPNVIINAAVAQSMAISNNLILQGKATMTVAAGAVLTVGAQVTVAADATLNIAGNVTAATAIAVSGTVYLAGSRVQSEAQNAWLVLKNTAGSATFSGSASASAYIRGNGGIDASVSFSGNATLAAGNSPGTVFINGDMTMSSTSTLEIDVDSKSSYDQLIIKRKFTRNGILYAKFNNYIPNNGDSFPFATHSSSDGQFQLAHGNYFDTTIDGVKPRYNDLITAFDYSSPASAVVASLFLSLLFCILVL